jgi:hypothetical protein
MDPTEEEDAIGANRLHGAGVLPPQIQLRNVTKTSTRKFLRRYGGNESGAGAWGPLNIGGVESPKKDGTPPVAV